MKKIFIACFSLLFCACSLSISEVQEDFVCGEDKVFDVGGNGYKTAYFDIEGGHDVEKDGQCWMAENLNVGTKILNPGEEPSDDGMLEKWCMTDDWSADFISECDNYRMGESRKEVCQRRYTRRHANKQKSDKNYCDGINKKPKYGALYSWQESINYNLDDQQGICPVDWQIPFSDDWEKLKKNLKSDEISVAHTLKTGKFNGERVGTLLLGEENYFLDRKQQVIYLSFPRKTEGKNINITFRTLFSDGDGKNLFEGPMGRPFLANINEVKGRMFSIRCMKRDKKYNKELMKTRIIDTLTAKNDSIGGQEWFSDYKKVYFKEGSLFDELYQYPGLSSTEQVQSLTNKCKYGGMPEIRFFDSEKEFENNIVIPVAVSWRWKGSCVGDDLEKEITETYYFLFHKNESFAQITRIFYSPDAMPSFNKRNIDLKKIIEIK